jgi:hypothetical protein
MRTIPQLIAVRRSAFLLASLSLAVAVSPAQAQRNVTQRRAKMWEGLSVSTKATVTFNGRTYTRTANAQCEFDERAAPGTQRVQWNVMYPPFGLSAEAAPLRTFALAIANPAAGKAIPFSFVFSTNTESPMIQTFGRPSGSGTVRIRRDGPRAIFDVSGKDDRGRAITATLECSQVRKPEAVGG